MRASTRWTKEQEEARSAPIFVWEARNGLFLDGEVQLGQWRAPLKWLTKPPEDTLSDFPAIGHCLDRVLKRCVDISKGEAGSESSTATHTEREKLNITATSSQGAAVSSPTNEQKEGLFTRGQETSDSCRTTRPIADCRDDWPDLVTSCSRSPPRIPIPSNSKGMRVANDDNHSERAQKGKGRSSSTGKPQMEKQELQEIPRRAPPLSVMMSTDFIVSSPVKENLMLRIALQQQRVVTEEEARKRGEAQPTVYTGKTLVGIFLANTSFTRFTLGHHATRVATEPNAGGASVVSEALSVEYFVRRFSATNVVSEMEVEYLNPNWKKVDYICDIYGQRVGVSVTRAMSHPDPELFNRERAITLLRKKLHGLTVARSGVGSRHNFVTAILHVWCETIRTAHLVQNEYPLIAKEMDVEEDVIMVLTVAEGQHGKPIFYESLCKDPALKEGKAVQNRHPFWWVRVKTIVVKK